MGGRRVEAVAVALLVLGAIVGVGALAQGGGTREDPAISPSTSGRLGAPHPSSSVPVSAHEPLVTLVPPLQDSVFRTNPPLLSRAYWLTLALSDVYVVATCRSKEASAFNFCVSPGVDSQAELGDCRTK